MKMSNWHHWLEDMSSICPGMDYYTQQNEFDDLFKSVIGLVGRLFKEGESCIVSTQTVTDQQWVFLLEWFHKVRMDAIYQHVVGTYLNKRVINKKTLLLFGDELRFKNLLVQANSNHIHRLPRGTNAQTLNSVTLEGDLYNTLLAGERILKLEIIEKLAPLLNPYAIIYDATQNGFRKKFDEHWELICSYFPEVPKYAIATSGDIITQQVMQKKLTHHVGFRIGDWSVFKKPLHQSNINIQCLFSVDHTFINTTNQILKIQYDLKSSKQDESLELRKSIYKILTILENSVVPFEILEAQLQKNARQGLFTVASVGKLIKDLKKQRFHYGTTQRQCDDALKLIEDYLACIEINGKTSLLLKQIIKKLAEHRSVVVLVDTKIQLQALFEYLSMQKVDFIDSIKIINKSAKPFKSLSEHEYDELFVTCKLWDNDYIWLTYPFKQITFIGYSNNEKWLDYGFRKFNQVIGGSTKLDGDKYRLLTYQFKADTQYLDNDIEEPSEFPIEKKIDTKSGGKYKHSTVEAIEIDFDQSFLFEDMGEVLEQEANSSTPLDHYNKQLCQIKVVLMDHPLCYPHEQLVQILDEENDDPIQSVKVEDLKPGDMLITINDSNAQRTNLLDEIFQELIASTDFFISYELAKMWDRLVNHVSNHFGGKIKDIQKALEGQKVNRSNATVLAWLNHKRIGPQSEKDLLGLATIVNDHSVLNSCHKVFKAIANIRTVRQQIGKAMNKSLRSSLDDDTVHKIAGHDISNEELRNLISVNEVVEVIIPTKQAEVKYKQLRELIPVIQKQYKKHIQLTNTCLRSMEESPYEDMEKALKCFEFLATVFIEHFRGKMRLDELEQRLQSENIEYARGTSDITQGVAGEYDCTFKGAFFKLDKHLKVGNSRDPKYLLRIYFEWLPERGKIVVCHAGKHKKTRKHN